MNNELNIIIRNSFLNGLLEEGVTIFTYENEELYYEQSNSKIKADFKIPENDALNLVKNIALHFGEKFDTSTPHLKISNSEIKITSSMQPLTDFFFYVEISK